MKFEDDYSNLVTIAGVFCVKNQLSIQPEELVNEAYLRFFETGEEYSLPLVQKFIYSEGIREKNRPRQIRIRDVGNILRTDANVPKLADLNCRVCKEALPISLFKKHYKINGLPSYCNICLSCNNKQRIEWQKKNKEMWNEYMKKWRIVKRTEVKKKKGRPIHELWNEANARYNAKQKELLTDVYIKKLLRNVEKTPENIQAKREELLKKRLTSQC